MKKYLIICLLLSTPELALSSENSLIAMPINYNELGNNILFQQKVGVRNQRVYQNPDGSIEISSKKAGK